MIRFNKEDLLYLAQAMRDVALVGHPQADIIFAKATLMLQEGNYEGYKVRRRKARVQSNAKQTIGRNPEGTDVWKAQVQGEQLEESGPSQEVPERCNPSLTRIPFGETAG